MSPLRNTPRLALLLPLAVLGAAGAQEAPHEGAGGSVVAGAPSAYAPWTGETALEAYVARDDGAFVWEPKGTIAVDAGEAHVLRLTSQSWRGAQEVSHPLWTHWLTVVVPERVAHDTAILVIGGGRRRADQPARVPEELPALARATGAVVVQIDNIPNQPLRFAGDTEDRFEDSIMARSWILSMDSGEPEMLARFAMVKAAVRAMDAGEAFLAGRGAKPSGWFVVGASKRGWTTWLTAAVDPRVRGIAPLVIDVLNLPAQLEHHHAGYGFWAPALDDYVREGVTDRIGDPGLLEVFRHEDPLLYQGKIGVPVYIVNAAGDQFFPADSASLYTGLLGVDWRLRVHPNAGHSLEGTSALGEVASFYLSVASGTELPRLAWERRAGADWDVVEVTLTGAPEQARLWRAENTQARDFRVDTIGESWTSRALEPVEGDGRRYEFPIEPAGAGWAACFAEFSFPAPGVGLEPLALTTEVFVTPRALPYSGAPENRSRR